MQTTQAAIARLMRSVKTKASILFITTLFIGACGSSTPQIYAEKYANDFSRRQVTNCQAIGEIFGGQAAVNENASSNCAISVRKKFDFICAYSASLNEDNDWELDSAVLETHLKRYKDAKIEDIFEAKTKGDNSGPISIIGLAHDQIVWLDIIGQSPYVAGGIPTLTIGDGARGTIEKSFLNRVTCIETKNIASKIELKFGFPF